MRHAPFRRATATAVAALLALTLGACDALAPGAGDGTAAPTPAAPMDPSAVAGARTETVDPTWLCRPGQEDPPAHTTDGGTLTPQEVSASGTDLTVSGPFRLAPGHRYRGFAPQGILLPADPSHRGAPAPGFDGEMGVDGAPVPPMVVRERVEVAGDGAAPSAVTAHLAVGTCDDAPLPEGQYLLRLGGGRIDGPGGEQSGWGASEDVLVDVVDGTLRAVPGVVSAPSGEVPADLSALACGAVPAPRGDGDGLEVAVSAAEHRVPSRAGEDGVGAGVTAEVSVTGGERGTRALLTAVVVVQPESGAVVAGARNAAGIPLQWLGEDGARIPDRAWTTQGACGGGGLDPGTYRALGVAVTLDAAGETHLLLTDPWDVEVVEGEAAAEQGG